MPTTIINILPATTTPSYYYNTAIIVRRLVADVMDREEGEHSVSIATRAETEISLGIGACCVPPF